MAEAVQAALVGPERKKLRIYEHEFNVKPAEAATQNNRLVVNGHLSHCLAWRRDDQIYYLITIEDGVIKDIQRQIARGGWAGLAGPVVSIVGAYFGVPIAPETVERLSRTLGQAVDGTWETACEILIANIAMAFQQQAREGTPSGTGPQGESGVSRRHVCAAGHILYLVKENGDLLWDWHEGYRDGTGAWAAPAGFVVSTEWHFPQVVAGSEGVLYAVDDAQQLLWFRHDGQADGTPVWAADHEIVVGTGWR